MPQVNEQRARRQNYPAGASDSGDGGGADGSGSEQSISPRVGSGRVNSASPRAGSGKIMSAAEESGDKGGINFQDAAAVIGVEMGDSPLPGVGGIEVAKGSPSVPPVELNVGKDDPGATGGVKKYQGRG